MTTHRIAIFASGSGTNAENIIRYFQNNEKIEVVLVLTNNPNAKVIKRSTDLKVNTFIFNKHDFYQTDFVLERLRSFSINFLVLAGFLWMIPENILNQFSGKIINIHPALLPKYGGKGMYGEKVHQAVKENNDRETGITIHLVNDKYDEGKIIFQVKCAISPENDTVEEIASKVHVLEYEHFPKVIEDFLLNN